MLHNICGLLHVIFPVQRATILHYLCDFGLSYRSLNEVIQGEPLIVKPTKNIKLEPKL